MERRQAMNRVTAAIVSLLLLSSLIPLRSQPSLNTKIHDAVKDFRGTVGVYVQHLRTGETVALNADTIFPSASMVKVPILASLFEKIEQGNLDYHAPQVYDDSLLYEGEDILGSFQDSATIVLSKLVMLMIATSDNTASLWLQQLCGTGAFINEWLHEHGFKHTRMNSRTPGRRDAWKRYGWGQTTPKEMAALLLMIQEKKAVSPGADEEMYRVLSNIYWSGEALSEIPPGINAASKQGAVNRSRSEVVLVNAPSGDYVFCVITKDQQDTSWEYDNEGFALIRTVSRILWNHFEPDFGWSPPAGNERWAK
jgi:beta-lactamase class A